MSKKSKQEAKKRELQWKEKEITPELLCAWKIIWGFSRFDAPTPSRIIVKLCDELAKCKNWNLDEVEWEGTDGKKYKGMNEVIVPVIKAGVGVIVIRSFLGVKKVLTGIRKGAHGEGIRAFPGGHIDALDVDLNIAGQREVLEETGMIVECRPIRGGWDFLTTYDILSEDGRKKYVTTYLLADWQHHEPFLLEPDKCEAWEWNTLDELRELVTTESGQAWIPIDRILVQRLEIE